MITVEELEPNIFKLTQSILTFTETIDTVWYWDFNKLLVSELFGFPKNLQTKELTKENHQYFNKHFLPLVKRTSTDYDGENL